MLLFMVTIFCLANLAVGVCAAAFFGHGPLRGSLIVRFISDPIIEPPMFLSRLRIARAASRTSEDAPESPTGPS